MALCGPKLSLCCLLLSVWGIVQLALMGIFFYSNSVALVEDLPLKEEYGHTPKDMQIFFADVERAYSQTAFNCWIAACMYIGTFLISAQQFYMNNKTPGQTSF